MSKISLEEWLQKSTGQALDDAAERYADREAVVFQDQRISYRQLQERVDRLARAFIKLGIQKGDKIAIWLNNFPEWIYAWLAGAKIGALIVGINTRYKEHEAEYVLQQSESTMLVTADRFARVDYLRMLEDLVPELRSSRPGELCAARFPYLKNVVVVGRERLPGMSTFEEVMELGHEIGLQDELGRRQATVKPDDVCFIQYTSGTTNFPKGAMLSHKACVGVGAAVAARMDVTEDDVCFNALPLFHIAAKVLAFLITLPAGACSVFVETFEAGEALRVLAQERCTLQTAVETMYIQELNHPDFGKYDLSQLRSGVTGGPPALIQMIQEKLIPGICNVYGITECASNVALTFPDEPLETRLHYSGRPQPGLELKIIDPQTGVALPPDTPGEICIRGWSTMKGYYKKPEETAKALDAEGWVHSGDRGFLTADGYLKYLGRFKDMLRVGGENVSAEEVEGFLHTNPKVKVAQVIGVPDPKYLEVPMAFVELNDGEVATETEVIGWCRERIAGFKVPRYVRFVRALDWPMTGNGKIQKFKLREQAVALLGLDKGETESR